MSGTAAGDRIGRLADCLTHTHSPNSDSVTKICKNDNRVYALDIRVSQSGEKFRAGVTPSRVCCGSHARYSYTEVYANML